MPIDISPSLKLTLLPPKAFRRDEAGKLINEKTDRPAFDTCAQALSEQTINMTTATFRIVLSQTLKILQRTNDLALVRFSQPKPLSDGVANTRLLAELLRGRR